MSRRVPASCRELVLVYEPAEEVAPADADVGGWSVDCGWPNGVGRVQRERAMRPVLVVMLAVGAEEVVEVSAAEDQAAVEALAAKRAYPPFRVRVRVRRLDRRLDYLDPFASEDLVKAAAELPVAIVDQDTK